MVISRGRIFRWCIWCCIWCCIRSCIWCVRFTTGWRVIVIWRRRRCSRIPHRISYTLKVTRVNIDNKVHSQTNECQCEDDECYKTAYIFTSSLLNWSCLAILCYWPEFLLILRVVNVGFCLTTTHFISTKFYIKANKIYS